MAIEDDVAAVFSDSQVKAIDFSLEKLTVNSHRLAIVGEAIKNKRITVEVKSGGVLLGAAYSPHPNRMTLSNADMITSPVGRAGVLHEGVHALVDLFKEQTLTVLQDEAAAYIAEVIYLRSWGLSVKSNDAETRAIYAAAAAIVQDRSMHAMKGVKLKQKDCQDLITAIHAHPGYADVKPDAKVSGLGVPD